MLTQAAVFALMAVALCCPLNAQWRRVVFSGKGGSVDVPASHPLSYFTANPFLRDDGEELCVLCTPVGKAESARKYAIRSVVKPLGVLAGFRIVDVLYYVNGRAEANAKDAKWKSILVEAGAGRYKEIFHLQAFYTSAPLGSARIIQSGNERVLATMDPDGGNGGGCWEGYWWFDRNGPHSFDFSALEAGIRERLSAAHEGDAAFHISCSSLDLGSRRVKSEVQKAHPRCRACDRIGEVTARFRLDGALVRPIAIEFQPDKTLP